MILNLFIFFLLIPFFFILIYLIKKNIKFFFKFKYEHIVFILFILIILCSFFVYILFYFLIFFYKNYRFYKHYYPRYNASKFFYYRKIVYFSFWRYLLINIIKSFFTFFIFLKLYIKGFFFKFVINTNFFIISAFYIKLKILTFYYLNYMGIYNKFLAILEHMYIFFNLDEFVYFFQRKYSLISNKYVEDPMFEKLGILKFSKKFYENYPFWNFINFYSDYYFFLKDLFLLLIIYIYIFIINSYRFINKYINTYNIIYLYKIIYDIIFKFLSYIIYIYILFIELLYKIKYIFLFIIYNIIIIIFFIINSILKFFYKYKLKLFYICLFFLILKNFWIVHLFFLLLYKHYTFNLPVTSFKESIRFFNFEFIDLRNYYNLVFLHNTLVDISLYNNTIYNDLLKYLHLNLDIYGVKLSDIAYSSNINLYEIFSTKNNDTILLNDILKTYNKVSFYKKNRHKFFVNEFYISKIKFDYNYTDEYVLKRVSNNQILNNLRETNWINRTEIEDYNVYFNQQYYPINKEQSQHYSMGINYYLYFYGKLWPHKTSKFDASTFLDLKNLPLSYIFIKKHVQLIEDFVMLGDYLELIIEQFEQFKILSWLVLFKKLLRMSTLGIRKFYEPKNYRKFFFGHYTSYENYIKNIYIKYQIPTYNLTNPVLIYSMYDNRQMYNLDTIYLSPEDYIHRFYKTLCSEAAYSNIDFDVGFIKKKFPYRLNKYYKHSDILNRYNFFFKTIKTGSKILKKYAYFYQVHIIDCNNFHNDVLENEVDIFNFVLIKWRNLDKPFLNFSFNSNYVFDRDITNLDFWANFYYLKFNKYFYTRYKNIYNLDYNINSMFILRARKDFYHIRQYFLRMMSNCIYNYRHQNVKTDTVYPIFIKNPDLLIYYTKNRDKLEMYKPVITRLFQEFRRTWNFNMHLTNTRTNKIITRAFFVYLQLFKYRYKNYSKFLEWMNQYNFVYDKKIISFKKITLNKISNLKRFFHRRNKNNTGWKILAYLNCFSLNFHIKHIIWHSPYSYLLLNNLKNILKIEDFNNNYQFTYLVDNSLIIVNYYSFVFNLFLNIMETKESWSYFLTLDICDSKAEALNYYSFYYYLNYGNFFFNNLNFIDLYRVFISLFFKYYNSFLFRLVRYGYILKYKNYDLKYFFLRFFNVKSYIKYLYIRFRLQIYRWQFWSRWIKRSKLSLLKPKKHFSWRIRKNNFLPFWFFFSEYIKLFIYLLLKYYYSKSFFINWWLYSKFSYSFIIYFTLKFFRLSYNLNLKEFYIKNYLFNLVLKNNILCFFIFILLKFDLIKLNINIVKDLFKIYFIMFNIELRINIKKLLYLKIIVFQIFKNYLNLFFKLRNKFVYFKSNYYYYKKQRVKARWALDKFNWNFWNHNEFLSFIRSTTKRDINNFSHFTKNFFLLKHLYFYNINTYIDIYNIFDTNWMLSSVLFSPLITLKFNTLYFFLFIYLLYLFLYFLICILYFKKKKKVNKLKILKKRISSLVFFKNFKSFDNLLFNFYKNSKMEKEKKKKKIKTLNYLINLTDYISYTKSGIGEFFSSLKADKWLKIFNKKTGIYDLKTRFEGETFYFRNQNFANEHLLKIWLFLFIIMIPMIFFEFLLWKYHLRGLIIRKRRAFVIFKMFFDNFKWYVKLNKIVGGFNSYHKRKMKYPRTYYHALLFRKRKKLKRGFFFRWDRFRNLYVKMAPLGSYYYWYEHLNKKKYYISFYKFFFNTIYKTKYYKFIIFIYLIFIWLLYRKLKFDVTYANLKKIRYIRLLEVFNIFYSIK